MSPYDTPGAIALITLGFLGCAIWLIRARRADIRRREERRAAAAYEAKRNTRHAGPRCAVEACTQPATTSIHGWLLCADDARPYTRKATP